MCLNITKITTNRMKKVLDIFGKVTCYKVVWVDDCGQVSSRYRYKYKWTAGWNKSDRFSTKLSQYDGFYGSVYKGIHVFLTKKQAIKMEAVRSSPNLVVIPVTCYKKDFVAGGRFVKAGSAVFTKVWVARKDLDKAIATLKGK